MTAALDNLERLLRASGYGLSNLVRLNIYSCVMDDTLQNLDVLITRLKANESQPAATLLGVTSLSDPRLLIEIEATAAK